MNQEYDKQNEEVVINAIKAATFGALFVDKQYDYFATGGRAPTFAAPPSERDDDFPSFAQPRKNRFEQPVFVSVTGTELEVCRDIARRQQLGIAKYGQTVAQNPLVLRDWLQHAYEEALDLSIYLKRAIQEIDKKADK